MTRARYETRSRGDGPEDTMEREQSGVRLLPVHDLLSMHDQGPNGQRIGRVHEVFVDAESLLVSYVSVSVGAFGRSQALVPVGELSIDEEDHGLLAVVPFSQEHLRNAPTIDEDELTPAREDEIAAYYRDADDWERNRQAIRARQVTPAPTPEIAAADLVPPEPRTEDLDSRRVSRRDRAE
jgi:hypothetical protein